MRHCLKQGGQWTSGIHILWQVRRRIAQKPEFSFSEIPQQAPISFGRQLELAAWSLVMQRLHFLSEVAAAAPPAEPLSAFSDTVEQAAEATETPDLDALLSWITASLEPKLRSTLPDSWYEAWRTKLHVERDDSDDDDGVAPPAG